MPFFQGQGSGSSLRLTFTTVSQNLSMQSCVPALAWNIPTWHLWVFWQPVVAGVAGRSLPSPEQSREWRPQRHRLGDQPRDCSAGEDGQPFPSTTLELSHSPWARHRRLLIEQMNMCVYSGTTAKR